mmetsp:Transcript_70920/g.167182  ORF Transcript_70920/g.167182 Transcript_70920/m.167182 type:complete len:201 (+) Transcript_70920:11-613(+)
MVLSWAVLVVCLVGVESELSRLGDCPVSEVALNTFRMWISDNAGDEIWSTVRLECDAHQGVHLRTTRVIHPHEQILAIPSRLRMDPAAALQSDVGGGLKDLDPRVALSLFLMREDANPKSRWRPYLDILPRSFDTPLFWDDQELRLLRPSPLFDDAHNLQLEWRNTFTQLKDSTFQACFLPRIQHGSETSNLVPCEMVLS